MEPDEVHIIGVAALLIIDCGISWLAFSTMLASGASVIDSNVSAVCPAIVVVGEFSRGSDC